MQISVWGFPQWCTLALSIVCASSYAEAQSLDRLPNRMDQMDQSEGMSRSVVPIHGLRIATVAAVSGRSNAMGRSIGDEVDLYIRDYLLMHATWHVVSSAQAAVTTHGCQEP